MSKTMRYAHSHYNRESQAFKTTYYWAFTCPLPSVYLAGLELLHVYLRITSFLMGILTSLSSSPRVLTT
jgi:hypothetical protein